MMKYKKLIVPAAAAFALVFSAAATASGWKLQNGSVPTRLVHAVNGEDLGLSQDLPVDIRIGYKCMAKMYRSVPSPRSLLRPGVHQVRITLANSRRGCRGTLVMADTIDVNFGTASPWWPTRRTTAASASRSSMTTCVTQGQVTVVLPCAHTADMTSHGHPY